MIVTFIWPLHCSVPPCDSFVSKEKHVALRAGRAEPVGARQVIPKVIETSDRQADNKPEWELHRETLVKQDEDAVVLA